MKTRAEELDRICLWLLLTGGLISLLVYGLASFISQPTAEIITTHAPALDANAATDNAVQETKYHAHRVK